MSNFYDNLNKAKQGIHLSAEAKQNGKEQLLHFIRAHEAMQARPVAARGASWFASNRLFVRVGTSFALLVIVGGSTSLAAASALPGDALYAVKLNVNEKIRSAVALSPESEAKLDAELAAARLDEVSQLSIEGRMSAEAEAKIAANFEAFADRAEAKIEALKLAGKTEAAADVSARFESALSAHASILARLEAKGETNVEPIRAKIGTVLAALNGRDAVATTMMAARAEVATDTSAEIVDADGRVKAASVAVAAAKRYLGAKGGTISEEAKADAEARIRAAQSLIGEAKADAEAGFSASAAAKAGQAFRIAEETKVLTQVQVRADYQRERSEPEQMAKSTAFNFLAADDHDNYAGASAAATLAAPDSATSSEATSTDDAEGDPDLNVDGSLYLESR